MEPVDRTNQCLVGGGKPEDKPDYREILPSGQQKDYVVLCDAERAKGFVRPVRRSYRHVGAPQVKNLLRNLTDSEKKQYAEVGYVKFEKYPDDPSTSVIGRYYTQEQLDRIGNGCGTVTSMGDKLAETYARSPDFYSHTYCTGCGTHLPVSEFVWQGTSERLGT